MIIVWFRLVFGVSVLANNFTGFSMDDTAIRNNRPPFLKGKMDVAKIEGGRVLDGFAVAMVHIVSLI
ncbi:hypothetical protein FQZ97_1036910 [compost metagenome]